MSSPRTYGSRDRFPASWTDRLFFYVVAPALSLVAVWYGAQGLGPAYRARFGHGTTGVFTAEHESCGRSCFWTGSFTAATGYIRPSVGLASGHGPLRTGDTVSAVDTGDSKNVFPKSGGWDWLLITAIMLGGSAYLLMGLRWLATRAGLRRG